MPLEHQKLSHFRAPCSNSPPGIGEKELDGRDQPTTNAQIERQETLQARLIPGSASPMAVASLHRADCFAVLGSRVR